MVKTKQQKTPAAMQTDIDQRLEDLRGEYSGLAATTENVMGLCENVATCTAWCTDEVKTMSATISQLQQQVNEQEQLCQKHAESLSDVSKDIQILKDAGKDIDMIRSQIRALWDTNKDMAALRNQIQASGNMGKDIPYLRNQVIAIQQDLDNAGSRSVQQDLDNAGIRVMQSDADTVLHGLRSKQDVCTVLRRANADLQDLTGKATETVESMEGTLGSRIHALETAFLDERGARLQVLEAVSCLHHQISGTVIPEMSTKTCDPGLDGSDSLSTASMKVYPVESNVDQFTGRSAPHLSDTIKQLQRDVSNRMKVESSKWEDMEANITQLRAELNYLGTHVRLSETSRSNAPRNFNCNQPPASPSPVRGRSPNPSNPIIHHSPSNPLITHFGQQQVIGKSVIAQPATRMASVPGGSASVLMPATHANREFSPGCSSFGESSRQAVILQNVSRLTLPGRMRSPMSHR